ncbi:unnamed protein product [Polarella glacialis]|uniref:Uncharacterized protein n=1 Tax=Polarella glacialis TaxID=89957 RepID=A0A813I7A2_POLGL|nr:unnamed protein product [Polarella glacialis]
MELSPAAAIDASKAGGPARFMNHSCAPNCYAQRWVVAGRLRVGLFAARPVARNEELTFSYVRNIGGRWHKQGREADPCRCGAEACSGAIGLPPPPLAKRPRRIQPIEQEQHPQPQEQEEEQQQREQQQQQRQQQEQQRIQPIEVSKLGDAPADAEMLPRQEKEQQHQQKQQQQQQQQELAAGEKREELTRCHGDEARATINEDTGVNQTKQAEEQAKQAACREHFVSPPCFLIPESPEKREVEKKPEIPNEEAWQGGDVDAKFRLEELHDEDVRPSRVFCEKFYGKDGCLDGGWRQHSTRGARLALAAPSLSLESFFEARPIPGQRELGAAVVWGLYSPSLLAAARGAFEKRLRSRTFGADAVATPELAALLSQTA